VKTYLVHACCGPCLAASMNSNEWPPGNVVAYFFNPNVQPLAEHRLRLDSFIKYAENTGIETRIDRDYPLREFLRGVLDAESNGQPRCVSCYRMRLGRTAQVAADGGFNAFSTTLLSSPYQKREQLLQAGKEAADAAGVEFAPLDFRDGWAEGKKIARKAELHMQKYCGCIFSELDRDEALKRRAAREAGPEP